MDGRISLISFSGKVEMQLQLLRTTFLSEEYSRQELANGTKAIMLDT